MSKNHLNISGFSLMEVIMIIVLVSVFMGVIAVPFVAGIKESHMPEILTRAYFLGVERMEELSAAQYDSIVDEAWASVSDYTDYERMVDVEDIDGSASSDTDPVDLDNAAAGVDYKRITVTVRHNEQLPNGVSLTTLRTTY